MTKDKEDWRYEKPMTKEEISRREAKDRIVAKLRDILKNGKQR